MLWACLHFPDFSLQLTLRASPAAGPTIVTTDGNRPEVLSCNAQARRHGIAPGMTVSAAIALAPELHQHPRDPASETKALEGAAAWAGQFTSMVSLAQSDALLLEIEGSLRLFGGLRSLLLHLGQDLASLGYTAAIAVAPTPTAARLLARAAIGSTITDIAALETALAELPLCLLDQPEDICWTNWIAHSVACPIRERLGLRPPATERDWLYRRRYRKSNRCCSPPIA
jgi:protein ImuB